ncbi:hypothetical protein P261_01234 [Lachnospiraceae bacterium TWA4]|nr:hypothetical protein P261_01234 [Lachnospiraceae bacterium TWA4]
MRDMGIEVSVLTTECSDELRKDLEKNGVQIETYTYLEHKNKFIQKIMNYLHYRNLFKKLMGPQGMKNSVLWIGSEQSAIKMLPFIKHIHPLIVNCLEFYENDWYQKGMKKVIKSSRYFNCL